LLTAVGLTPGGSSTVHIYTKITHRATLLIGKSAGRAPSLRVVPGICLTTEEKARKNFNQGSRRVQVGTTKTEYTEQNIHKNKNT